MKKIKLFKALMLLFSIMLISPQMWAVNAAMTSGETLFIIADGNGAWDASACVRACFSTSDDGDGDTKSNPQATGWLWDGSWDSSGGKKCFYTIVPTNNTYKSVRLFRYASDCSTPWNWNGGWAKQSKRSKDYYNCLYSSGSGDSNFGWKNATYSLNLYGETNSWGSAIGTLVDCGNGVFKYSFKHKATQTSYQFKIQDSQSQWHGSNVTLSSLTNGRTYIITATVDLKSGIGSLAMSAEADHTPGVYETAVGSGGYGQTLKNLNSRDYEVYHFASTASDANYICAGTTTTTASNAHCMLKFATTTECAKGWMANYVNGRGSSFSSLSASGTEFNGMGTSGAYTMNYRSNSKLTIIVSGYDQFSMYGKDNSASNKFQVYIDGSNVTTGTSTTASVRRYNLTTGRHEIEVTAVNSSNCEMWGFSLRIPCTAPTALTASSLTTSGATLTVTDAANTNDYEFYVNTSSSAPGPSSTATYTVSGGKSKVISDLSAGTTYYAWARSKCSSTNKSDWVALTGSTFTTTSAGCTSVAAPTALNCSAQTKNSLTFGWTKASNASTYTATLYSDEECTSEVTHQDLGNVATVTFTSLSANTTYYCTVQSHGDGETYCSSGGTTSAQSGTTKAVHSISFDSNGGSGSLSTISNIEHGTSQTLTAIGSNITRTGWTFTGWNTNKYGTGTAYADQATINPVNNNITLYAQWSKTVYLKVGAGWDSDDAWFAFYYWDDGDKTKNGYVTMSLAESCSSPAVYKGTVPGNGYTHLLFLRMNPANKPTPSTTTGKWNQTLDLAYSNLTSNNQFTITSIDGCTDSKSCGSWGTYSAPTYTIKYAKGTPPTGSATISGSKSDQTKNCGVDFTLPNVVFTLAGYTQDGWATSDGGDKAYNLGGSYTTEAAQTFYPHWSANSYSVTHTLSNVTASSGSTGASAATCGTNYTAVFAASSGYTLPTSITVTIGGNSTTAGTEYTWTKGTGTVVVNGAYITGNVVITVAGIVKKSVTYKKNGGASGADGSVTGTTSDGSSPYEHGSTVTTIANGYTNDGYKFKWWNTAYDGSGEDFYVGEKFNITANTLLYAQWEEIGTGEEFWVGDPKVWHATTHDVTVGDMNIKPQDYSSNDNMIDADFTGSYKAYTIVNATEKRAIVMAVGASDKYVEISFADGSTINELEVGVAAKDGTDPTMAVLYSTTSDFSSGLYYLATPVIPTIAQTSKQVTTVNPDVEDTYKYVRIYSKIYTAVYSQTGGSGNKLRIYSIKAKKGASCTSLDAPEGLSCTAQTKNSLTFGWSAVTNASSYDVYLYSDEDCTAEVTPTEGKPYNVTGTSATLTGLDGGTTYYCKVRTKGNGTTYCTNGGITTTAASGKTKYVVTYAGNSQTSGSVPTDANDYASGDEVTVLGKNTLAKTDYTFRGWTYGDYFYKEGDKFTMPAANVTLTAVWESNSGGGGENILYEMHLTNYNTYEVNSTYGGSASIGSFSNTANEIITAGGHSHYKASGTLFTATLKSGLTFQAGDSVVLYMTASKDSKTTGYKICQSSGSSTTVLSVTQTMVSGTEYALSAKLTAEMTTIVGVSSIRIDRSDSDARFYGVKIIRPGGGGGSSNYDAAFGTNEGVVGTPSLPSTIEGVPSGKKIVRPADPTATGYIFDNWYPTQACNTSAFNWSGTITKDTTIYAKFNTPTTLIQQPAKVAGKRVPMDTLDAYRHPEIDSVIVHQLIDPAPYGTCNISYKLCYSNHVQLDEQPVIHYGTGAGVGYDTVWMPMEEIQKYELVAYLRTGATRGEGDLVTTDTAIVSVENRWPIKVRYMKDGVELREPTQWSAYPSLKATEAIRIPAERNGYILDSLEYGVGITVDSAKYIDYIGSRMYQVYLRSENAATVTAHYKVAPNTVYFFDTFEDPWYTPYIFDYGTTGYWDNGQGAGAAGHLGTHATRIDFMDRMYMMPIGASTTKLAIGSDEQKNPNGTGFDHFYTRTYTPEGWDHSITVKPEIFYRTDFNQALPMFVPVVKSSSDYYVENTEARYFRGFWVKYSPDRDSTGYYLKVYDQVEVEGATLIQSIPMTLAPTGEDGTWELTATMDLEGGKTYGFKYTKATGASTCDWYGNAGTMNSTNHTDWLFTTGTNNCGLTTTSAGDYTFHLHCVNYGTKAANAATDSEVQGKMVMTVDYATNNGDYRVVYVDDAQTNLTVGKSNVEPIASQTIRARENGQDTVTFYIRKDATNRSMKFQKFNDGAWSDVAGGTIALTNTTGQTFTVSTDTTYQIYIQQNEGGTSVEATGMDYYSGLYYIRTDCVDEHKWDYKQSMEAHRMVESDYASHLTTDPFTHYYVHWVAASKNVKFVVATQYSPTLTDTLITDDYANVAGGNLPSAGASVRFMYNKGTNAIKRAYLAGAQGGLLNPNFLKLTETSSSKMKNMSGSAITSITFGDLGNFTYQAEIQAQPGLTGKLTAEYNSQTQYFKGGPSTSETILGGTGLSWQHIVMTYDFKTNRLICAWTPGDTIDETLAINADIMIIRRGQHDAEQIVFKTNETKLTNVKYVYGVIQLDYNDLVGMMPRWDYWAYEHCMYYISFPFDVLVSDITGVGSIGKEWRIQRYNGAKRAEKGWFEGDGVTTFWEDVQAGDTLHAYEGYSLLLNRTRFNSASSAIWENKSRGSSVYLFFPSLNATTGIVADGSVTVHVPSHLCTIDRNFINQYGASVNHKNTDSHWNMLGMPLFENKTAFSVADNYVDPEDHSTENIKYIYAWNSAGNTLGIRLALDNTWTFKTMYSYMVQYAGDVVFKGSTVSKIVAATRDEEQKNYHVNLELSKDDAFVGRTYVELRENAVDSFLLNEDIYMVKNGVTADLYTLAGGYEVGANVLPVENHVVPVGIDVRTAGAYVFSMPSNFSGTVTLVDTYHQTRTNLALEDYEIALPKGNITDRFYLEINVNNAPTAIDGITDGEGSLKDGKAHKFIMNDMMYILKDGVLYDAQGKRVE